MSLLRRLFAKFLALLRPARPQHGTPHRTISSYDRRYPGRTPAAELRRNLGWVAVTAGHSHRDRRA
jgi:hypothetical protein